MKTSPAMCRIGKLFGVLFLIPHLGFWSIHGEESCIEQLSVKRHSAYHAPAGSSFKMECPVKYCAKRPNMTWCKFNGTQCFQLGDRLQPHTSWEERQNISVFFLHFEPVLPSDNGSYSCQAHFRSFVSPSHSIILYVTDAPTASGPPSKEEVADKPWLLYSLLPVGGFSLLIIACFCLFCYLKRHQGKQKKPSDIEGREINLVDVSQPLRSEQAEVSIRENSQTLPSQTEIYDNDSLFRIREGSEVYSNPSLDENKQGIVYASLNHSIIGVNLRQARPVQEAPTEYASVCVRSQSRS
ncbi:B- and T-lymphocyte attenuator isoform X1 [Callospermophilus lateralis]|uniref:B- and T-lymphocyte attenuator isoform X1 n=1 Tax=Callospermophilus lateralis TaxID=76772 RepID=UPI00405490DE